MRRLLLVLVLVTSPAAGQTVTVTGDGAAQVVSVGIPGPAGPAWTGGHVSSTVSMSPTTANGYASIFALENPLDPTHGGYYFLADWSPAFLGRTDPVAFLGYNVTSQGQPRNASEPVWVQAYEADYEYAPGSRLMEYYLQYVSIGAGTILRPYSFTVDRTTHFSRGLFATDELEFSNAAGTTQRITFSTDHHMNVIGNTQIRKAANNNGFIYQANSTGTQIALLYMDSANVTQISTAGYPTQFRDDEVRLTASTFAALNGSAPNGTLTYCSDCAKATPCAGSGNGALAKRLNGAWDCD